MYVLPQTVPTNEERDEHKRMINRLKVRRWQQKNKDDAELNAHRLAIQRASYYRHREARLAAKR